MANRPDETPAAEQRRLRILLAARFLLAIAVVAALIALEGGSLLSSARFKYAYFILLVVCAADLLYVPLFRRLRSPLLQGGLQSALDVVAATALVYLSGGVNSPFVVLYFAVVVAGALYLPPLGALLFGTLCALLFLGIGFLFHGAAVAGTELPLVSGEALREHTSLQEVAGAVVLPALGFLGVGFLASRLVASSARERVVMEEILQGMEDGVVTVDDQGRIVFINPAARKMLGLDPALSPLGKPLSALEDMARISAGAETLKDLEAGGDQTAEIEVAAPRQRILQMTASPVENEKGQRRGTVNFIRDLTVQKRMEEAVRRAGRLEDISEMAAGIAHEMRNPLASLRGSIQELHTSGLQDEDDKRLMKVILKESDRLNRIIEGFLRFAEEQSMNLRDCDLGAVLEDVATSLRRGPGREGLHIRIEREGDLVVQADEEAVRQVFSNLCQNAVEAMEGSGSLLVRAAPRASIPKPRGEEPSSGEEVEGVSVDVSDTGSGIPPEILSRIFNPFFSTKPKGFGMGLSLVHRIVDAHRGTVKADSSPGAGSTFTVWLPRTPPPR